MMPPWEPIASAVSALPWRVRRQVYDLVGQFLGLEPNVVADEIDGRLDLWREQERAV